MHALGPRNVPFAIISILQIVSNVEVLIENVVEHPNRPKMTKMLRFRQDWIVDSPIIPENTCARVGSSGREVSIMCKE